MRTCADEQTGEVLFNSPGTRKQHVAHGVLWPLLITSRLVARLRARLEVRPACSLARVPRVVPCKQLGAGAIGLASRCDSRVGHVGQAEPTVDVVHAVLGCASAGPSLPTARLAHLSRRKAMKCGAAARARESRVNDGLHTCHVAMQWSEGQQ
jgi:hypothetical protein